MSEQTEGQRLADEYEDAPQPTGEEPWTVRTLADCDWALERLAELEQQIRDNNALHEAALARLEDRRQLLNEKVMRGVKFFRGHLNSFALTSRETLLGTGKKKSRELLHGTISYRKTGGGLEVLDKEKLLAWAQRQPVELNFIRTKEEPAIDKIKEAFKAKTGEIPDGCDVRPEGDEISIKTIERMPRNDH